MQSQLLIDGQLVNGRGATQPVYNPATGEVIAQVAEASPEQVDRAVLAADAAFAAGANHAEGARRASAQAGGSDRRACRDFRRAGVAQLRQTLSLRVERRTAGGGRRVSLLRRGQPLPDRHGGRRVSGRAYLDDPPRSARRGGLDRAVELPADDGGSKLAPALAAGNCVVIKPSEQTPLTTFKLAELAAGLFPPGVLNVLFGRGAGVGDRLTGHDKVRMVSLTGSIATGEHIIAHTAAGIKRTHMELGGKAPVLVFDDADLQQVVDGIRGFGFYNAGQDCTAACRIYAQKAFMPSW